MKTEFFLTIIITVLACQGTVKGQSAKAIEPDGTYMFVQRDTCELYLDVYNPAAGSLTYYKGQEKPTVLFVFGGGFISGRRDEPHNLHWYKELTENGYRVIAIDYRLGLKGAKSVGVGQVDLLDKAIHLAVEDLFSATAFIIENAEALGVNPAKIVLCGSSAGAITVLQAEYELCNRTSYTSVLPKDFRYAGVMSFAGAILSRSGKLTFDREPSPILLFHGTDDKLVNYKQIKFFNLGFFGSDKIVERLEKFDFCYTFYRYPGHGHEIAGIMDISVAMQDRFIKENVMEGRKSVIDAIVTDAAVPSGKGMSQSRKDLYGN